MNDPLKTPQSLAAPSLASLMSRYLAARQEQDEQTTEVEPHDAATGFRTNVTATWAEASLVFRLLHLSSERVAPPPEWAAFLAEDAVQPLPLVAGLAPQRFRQMSWPSTSTPTRGAVPGLVGLRGWLRQSVKSKSPAQLLLASGLAIELGELTEAQAALTAAKPLCIGDWQTAWLNQLGAYQLRTGQQTEAEATWQQLPHAGLKAFNLGLCAALMSQPTRAAEHWELAADALPEDSGWSHLARLYSTLID